MPANSVKQQPTADRLIDMLQLSPHPEGGYFKETFRDSACVDAAGRAASTAIYFLLRAGQVSRWHRLAATEMWHWYAGSALELRFTVAGSRERIATVRLGNSLLAGEAPQAIVPPGCWQQARSLGDYTLVGCTMAPGFVYEGFELAPEGFAPVASDS